MNKAMSSKLWWKCPQCGNTVDFTNELIGSLFDENNGEALFNTAEGGGVLFHTIFCSKCRAAWTMSISGLEKDFMNDNA